MLIYTLKLELLCDDYFWAKRNRVIIPWEQEFRYLKRLGHDKSQTYVARILNNNRYLVQGVRDYSQADRTGSKGIYVTYSLEPGLYEVNHRYKINKVRKYLLRVNEDGSTVETNG